MKRTITRMISMLLVLTICLSCFPLEAFAWGKMTHVYTANLLSEDALDGSVTIGYNVNSENGGQDLKYSIPQEYVDAIQAYPEMFRAGALGPDMYPDIITGQMYIHPEADEVDSGAWVAYLCNAVNKMGKDTEGRKMTLAFTLGCILHYCGDLFGHDFVNTFAGGSFPSLLSSEILDIKGERLNNVLSHMSVEKYMDSQLYPSYSVEKDGAIDAPDEFVTNSMVFDGTPAAGLNPIYKDYPKFENEDLTNAINKLKDVAIVGDIVENIIEDYFDEDGNNVPPHYTAFLALRSYVASNAEEYREHMDPVSAAITRYNDEWLEDIDAGMAAFAKACDNIAQRMVTGEKNPVIEEKKIEELKGDYNAFMVMAAENFVESLRDAGMTQEQENALIEATTMGITGNSFFDEIQRELIREGVITKEMLAQSEGSITIIKEEFSYWWDEYAPYMLFPDIIVDGIEIPLIGDIIDLVLLKPLWTLIKEAIKKEIAEYIVSTCTGAVSDVTGLSKAEVGQHIAGVIEKIDDRIEDPKLQLDHPDNPYKPSANNFAELEEAMATLSEEQTKHIMDSDMESLYNTLTMFQLVLMGPENYAKFIKDNSGVKQTAYQTNTACPEVTSLEVRIKTSDLFLAGTDDNIYMIVYENGSGSKEFKKKQVVCKLLDISGTNDFESGDTASYTIELPRSVKLSQMEIALKKTPAFDFSPSITDDWRCENIRVTPKYAGYELTAPVDLGGVFLQGICESIGMNFQDAMKAKSPEDSKSQTVTNLLVQIKVKDELYAGTDSDIYLKVYNNGSLYQSVLLDKAAYNDLERADNDTYNIPIVRPGTKSQGIPLNRLTVKFDHTGSDETSWQEVWITPCYGSVKLTNAISVGGKVFEKSVWKPDFQKALKKATYRQEPNMSKTATTLKVQVDVANELYAGTDDDVYLNIYSGNSTKQAQRIILDKENYNDFEQGDSDVYTISLSKEAAKIPLNQMRLEFEKDTDEDDDGRKDNDEDSDDAKWDEVLVTFYNGSKALTDSISLGGMEFAEESKCDANFRTNLKLHYSPIVLSYKTNLDDGLLSYMDSLDGGEEWVDAENELWNNTTLRKEIFFKIFKGFAPEIEYAGSASILKDKPIDVKLNFTGEWNGVSNDRRSQVKDFKHVYAVAGTADIEFLDDAGKSLLKTTGVKIADNQVNISIPYNESLAPGYSYDIKVTYRPDKANPVYADTSVVFKDALSVTVPNSCIVRTSASPKEGGSVVGRSGSYKYGETCTVNARPNAGYLFVEWRNDAGAVLSKNASYTFTVNENCNLVAVFKAVSSEYKSVINDGKSTLELSMGQVHTLNVKVEGGTAPYTYEWQYLEPGKTTWKRGTTSATAGILGDDTSNSRRYRVEVTDAAGKKSISNEVAIVVKGGKFAVQINDGAPEIVFENNANSPSQTLTANITGGTGPYTYKWYAFARGNWAQVSSNASLNVACNDYNNGNKIKVEVTDSTGKVAKSEEVTVTIKHEIVN